MPPKLSLHDLTQKARQSDKRREESFDEILKRCHSRIKRASNDGLLSCVYPVPSFIVGLPLVQVEPCLLYIRAALTCDGLYAEINQDNSLFITWDPAFLKQMSAREQSSQAVAPRSDLKEQMIAQRLPLPPLAPHAQKYSKISLPF